MTYVIANLSGGKDSTAMVIRMIEKGEDLDEVVFCDTGMEFPVMYDHIARVKDHVEESGVRFVTLKADLSFRDLLLDYPIHSEKYGDYLGFGWPSIKKRWCTKHLKTRLMDRHRKALRESGEDGIVTCTGLAADEAKRIEKPQNIMDRHPLAEWGWTEDMALGYCYGKGFDWYDPAVGKGLYEIFDRTSCWICPLSNLEYLRRLRRYYPDLWLEIGRLETRVREQRLCEGNENVGSWSYTLRYTWADLEARFAHEDDSDSSQTSLTTFGGSA